MAYTSLQSRSGLSCSFRALPGGAPLPEVEAVEGGMMQRLDSPTTSSSTAFPFSSLFPTLLIALDDSHSFSRTPTVSEDGGLVGVDRERRNGQGARLVQQERKSTSTMFPHSADCWLLLSLEKGIRRTGRGSEFS